MRVKVGGQRTQVHNEVSDEHLFLEKHMGYTEVQCCFVKKLNTSIGELNYEILKFNSEISRCYRLYFDAFRV